MIVLKFGGSSVDSSAALSRVVGLIRTRLERCPVVVISAMAKTTNRLLEAAAAAAAGDLTAARGIAADLHRFHAREAMPVVPPGSLAPALDDWFAELGEALAAIASAGLLTPRMADQVAGYGEVLASFILTQALIAGGVDAVFVDCRRVIVTDATFTRAQPDYETTDECLGSAVAPLLAAGRLPVLGGYVGATRGGVTTTLGKEGSDFSAAIVGAGLGAEEIEIWTDVDGILSADPRLVPGARVVPSLTFAEAFELACSGAKKPHPGTLGPARRKGVPIRILSSRHPQAPGTLIGRRDPQRAPGVRSIACRSNAHLLYTVAGADDDRQARLLAACERLRPALMVLGSTAAGLTLALDRAERLDEVRAALSEAAPTEVLGVLPGRSVVSLVGDDLATDPRVLESALDAAREHEPRLVLAGVASPTVRFLVDDAEAAAAVARVHERLFAAGHQPLSAGGAT